MCLSVIHLGEGVNEDVRPFNWLHVIYYFTRLARERERERAHLIFILYSFNHMALLKTSLGLNISVFKKKNVILHVHIKRPHV